MGSVLVLDLDETLLLAIAIGEVSGPLGANSWQKVCQTASDLCRIHWPELTCMHSDSYFMFIRPYAVPFLQYCRKQFKFIVIFTAGTQMHADYIHEKLFQAAAGVTADFVFHRDSCGKFARHPSAAGITIAVDTLGSSSSSSSNKSSDRTKTTLVQFQKNLCHLREQVELQATEEQRAAMDWTDCLYIDDLAMHATNNCGEMLLVPKFDYPCLHDLLEPSKPTNDTAMLEASTDQTLLKLMHFMHTKAISSSGFVWQQVDKRFALFC